MAFLCVFRYQFKTFIWKKYSKSKETKNSRFIKLGVRIWGFGKFDYANIIFLNTLCSVARSWAYTQQSQQKNWKKENTFPHEIWACLFNELLKKYIGFPKVLLYSKPFKRLPFYFKLFSQLKIIWTFMSKHQGEYKEDTYIKLWF